MSYCEAMEREWENMREVSDRFSNEVVDLWRRGVGLLAISGVRGIMDRFIDETSARAFLFNLADKLQVAVGHYKQIVVNGPDRGQRLGRWNRLLEIAVPLGVEPEHIVGVVPDLLEHCGFDGDKLTTEVLIENIRMGVVMVDSKWEGVNLRVVVVSFKDPGQYLRS